MISYFKTSDNIEQNITTQTILSASVFLHVTVQGFRKKLHDVAFLRASLSVIIRSNVIYWISRNEMWVIDIK